MRALVLLGIVLTASASSVQVQTRYHETIGIPTAEKIRAYEEKVLKKESPFERIVGGALAPIDAYPYFAALQISLVGDSRPSLCGSSLLSANRLVTAAHCWRTATKQARQVVVVLGSNFLYTGGIRIATSQVIVHPQWNSYNLANDIAMIYLPRDLQFSASIAPISLPTASELSSTFEEHWAVAAGFGRTSDLHLESSSVLSHVRLRVVPNHFCRAVLRGVRNSNICTSGYGGVGICHGDSGGPLALNFNGRTILIGISSFGDEFTCGEGFPSAFTRVTSYMNFINQHMSTYNNYNYDW